jgi:Leu/Phe-tRNA-protein transferase
MRVPVMSTKSTSVLFLYIFWKKSIKSMSSDATYIIRILQNSKTVIIACQDKKKERKSGWPPV